MSKPESGSAGRADQAARPPNPVIEAWGEHVSRKYGQEPMRRFLANLLDDLGKQGIRW